MKTLHQVSSSWLGKICLKVNRAVAFIDKACAEIIHWHGGLNLLLQAGAADVKEFSSFESADPSQKKAVFLVSSLLQDVTSRVIQDIIQASQFQFVVVITTVSPHLHLKVGQGSEEEEAAVFEMFEDKLLQWLGNMNYTVEVEHIPLFTASLSPGLFVTPTFSQLFPLINSDLPRLNLQYRSAKADNKSFNTLREVECQHLPKSLRAIYKMLVSSINSMLDDLGVVEDCFSVGNTSRMIAAELSVFPPAKNRRKTSQGKASLVLIDRSLDLCSVCNHQPDTLLDKILSVLPRLPQHSNDVTVDMKSLCQIHSEAEDIIVPGHLASCTVNSMQSQLQPLLGSRSKEGLMDVNRSLVETASKEKLPIKLSGKPGRVTAEQLENTLTLFKGKYKLIEQNIDTLQTAMATCLCLKNSKSKHQENLGSEEKLMLQSIGNDDAENPLSLLLNKMLTELAKPTMERNVSFDDILKFLVHVYSLMGEEAMNSEEEEDIKDLLVKGIINEEGELPPLTKAIVGETVSEEVVSAVIDVVFDKLCGLCVARDNMKQLRTVSEEGTVISPAKSKPLLKQIIDLIFDPSKAELTDIEYRSSGFTDLLKSGFGLFRTVAKPRPSDNPLMIVFVIGGISATEAKQIKDSVAACNTEVNVLVGSTRLVQPEDIVEAVLCQDNLNPE